MKLPSVLCDRGKKKGGNSGERGYDCKLTGKKIACVHRRKSNSKKSKEG